MDKLQNLETATASELYALLLIYMQLRKSRQDRMAVTAILISLVALAGICMSNASTDREYIEFGKFNVGRCIEASYTAPTTGVTTIRLFDANGTVVLNADYRKHWGRNPYTSKPWENIFLFNSKLDGKWGREQHVKDVLTTPGTGMSLSICAEDTQFSIVFNWKGIANYTYRAPVTSISKAGFFTWGNDSILKKLCVLYSQPEGQ